MASSFLRKSNLKHLSNQAGFVSLDDTINPADYPDGVIRNSGRGQSLLKSICMVFLLQETNG